MFHSILSFILISGPIGIEWTAIPEGQISVECAGDVNGDGTEDCFTSGSEYNNSGVSCLDGLTGELLWQNDSIPGVWIRDSFRSIGDVNQDGIQDLAAGTGLSPSITVFSGADGNIIWSLPQSHPVRFLERASGPNPGDVAILVLGNEGSDWCYFYCLNGQNGEPFWCDEWPISTLDEWIKITDADVNGNGWSEMGFSIDRGSVMSGSVSVRDGFTGEYILGSGTCYFPTMDICDSPVPCLAVSHFGWTPSMWVNNMPTGSSVWTSDSYDLIWSHLEFIPDVCGSGYHYPDIIGWGGESAMLITGETGYYQDEYTFPEGIVYLDVFQESAEWKLVVLTETKLHCPVLTSISPQSEPSVLLPSAPAQDFCLLDSDQFPTPLVCIAMNGTGPGVCALRTSWQVQTDENISSPVLQQIPITLSSIPENGGITMNCNSGVNLCIMDLTGRIVTETSMVAGETLFVKLPPGLYFITDRDTGTLFHNAVVLH
jgi:hypothetical protein